jgi:hypothetical protein
LLSLVAFSGWFLFQAGKKPLELVAQFAKGIFAPEFTKSLVQTVSAPVSQLPLWGGVFREFYRWSLVALVLIGCLCSAWIVLKKRKTLFGKLEIVILMSSWIVSLIFLVMLLAIPGYGIGRFTAFAAFPAAFSTIVCLDYLIGTKIDSIINKRTIVVLLLIFIFSLSAVTTMLRFEGNQYLGELVHPSELSTLSFVYSDSQHPLTITMAETTSLFYDYFDYSGSDNVTQYLTSHELATIDSTNSTAVLNLMKDNCAGSNITIVGLRDQYELSLLLGNSNATMADFESTVLSSEFSRIYSNGYYSVYSRNP